MVKKVQKKEKGHYEFNQLKIKEYTLDANSLIPFTAKQTRFTPKAATNTFLFGGQRQKSKLMSPQNANGAGAIQLPHPSKAIYKFDYSSTIATVVPKESVKRTRKSKVFLTIQNDPKVIKETPAPIVAKPLVDDTQSTVTSGRLLEADQTIQIPKIDELLGIDQGSVIKEEFHAKSRKSISRNDQSLAGKVKLKYPTTSSPEATPVNNPNGIYHYKMTNSKLNQTRVPAALRKQQNILIHKRGSSAGFQRPRYKYHPQSFNHYQVTTNIISKGSELSERLDSVQTQLHPKPDTLQGLPDQKSDKAVAYDQIRQSQHLLHLPSKTQLEASPRSDRTPKTVTTAGFEIQLSNSALRE